MLAVIKTGGKQYQVKAGDKLRIEKIETPKDGKVVFDQVLLVSDEKGQDVKLGTPLVAGAKVEATVAEQGRADKITVVKYKAKVRYRRKLGHRQPFTAIQIDKIIA